VATEDQSPPEPESTGQHRVREVFGSSWVAWVWLKRQFSLTSLFTVLGLLLGLGGWAISLQTRVVVLETKVVPFVGDQGHLAVIDQRLTDHDRRLEELESDFEHARTEADKPPRVRR
jgi:hypothetical protein